MKYLKLKDNVDLVELEKLGFERGIVNSFYTVEDDIFIDINDCDRIIKFSYIGMLSNVKDNIDKIIKVNQKTNDFMCNLKIPSIIYTLIKLDLVEII